MKIDEILNDLCYDTDSDHGNMMLCDGINKAKQSLKQAMLEVIGDGETWKLNDGTANKKSIRNRLRSEQRNKLESLFELSEKENE